MQIIGNGRLFTLDSANPFFVDGAVVVDGTEVKAVGTTADMKKAYPDAEFFDAQGRVIMPGFINAHTHAYSAYARGCAPSMPQRNFFEVLENMWWRLDRLLTPADVELNALTTFKESIQYGVTTVIDHHSSPNAATGSLFTMAEAAKKIGIRASLCYEVSDRDGKDIFAQEVAENVDFMKWANSDDSDMIKGLFGLHASFTLSADSLEACVAAKEGVKGGYHVHVAEGRPDVVDSNARYGKPIVERFADLGMLGPETIAVHCVHINTREAEQLVLTDTNVVHNPESNMNNAVGLANTADWVKRGMRLGLGTDAYTPDMLESLKVAAIVPPHENQDPTLGFMEAGSMLFVNNADICGKFFDGGVGKLKPGYHADLITMDYRPFTPFNGANLWGHAIFGMHGSMVVDTMINGEWVYRDRQFTKIDEAELDARSAERAAEIWKHM